MNRAILALAYVALFLILVSPQAQTTYKVQVIEYDRLCYSIRVYAHLPLKKKTVLCTLKGHPHDLAMTEADKLIEKHGKASGLILLNAPFEDEQGRASIQPIEIIIMFGERLPPPAAKEIH